MLEIPFPDGARHDIPPQVVCALGTEYGFQFTALSVEQRRFAYSAALGVSARVLRQKLYRGATLVPTWTFAVLNVYRKWKTAFNPESDKAHPALP
jgi:hypothetical protein